MTGMRGKWDYVSIGDICLMAVFYTNRCRTPITIQLTFSLMYIPPIHMELMRWFCHSSFLWLSVCTTL